MATEGFCNRLLDCLRAKLLFEANPKPEETQAMAKRESLYAKHPDYRVDLEASDTPFKIEWEGVVIAESRSTLTVRETNLGPVTYCPMSDLDAGLLTKSSLTTFCPFKGEASYWSVKVGDQVLEDSIWGYEEPFDEVSGLKGYVAFYLDRFEVAPPA